MANGARRATLRELALLFLRLGATAFGGPAAHVALMQDEVVKRRKWLSPERFLDLLGAANLIPGPSSTELAIYIGYEQAGWRGLVVAGACFILPAALIVAALAWLYLHYGSLPALAGVLYGVKPVVIAVVAHALWRLAPKATKGSPRLAAIGLAAAVAAALGVEPLALLIGSGIVAMVATPFTFEGERRAIAGLGLAAAGATNVTLFGLFSIFLKIGAISFGSGYVLLAFLRADLVDRLHWLSEAQLLDAVAIGQVTPGPVFTTATFIGYLLAGPAGAAVATIAIFLPGFALVASTRPLLARVRKSAAARAFLDGVNMASLALMLFVTMVLAKAALVDLPTIVIALAGAVLLIRFELSSNWIVAGGALAGLLLGLP